MHQQVVGLYKSATPLTKKELRSFKMVEAAGIEPQGSGTIVNVLAITSIRQVGYSCMAYGASKAAVNQLTQSIAIEYAEKGIRANTILPGLMHTPV